MKELVVNKEFLKGYKYFSITLENGDHYKIDVEDIVDVSCRAVLTDDERKVYETDDGFIKIAARAKDTQEACFLEEKNDGVEEDDSSDIRLKERLECFDGAVDICCFSLCGTEEEEIDIYVPYAPLEEVFHGNVIEFSNCASLETDAEENMCIAFGKSSKIPQRKDNDFSNLIKGWRDCFGEYEPAVLNVKVRDFCVLNQEELTYSMYFEMQNKGYRKKKVEFIFSNCEDLYMQMFFPQKGDCEITISKMLDGKFYVGLYGIGIDFFCSDITISV